VGEQKPQEENIVITTWIAGVNAMAEAFRSFAAVTEEAAKKLEEMVNLMTEDKDESD